MVWRWGGSSDLTSPFGSKQPIIIDLIPTQKSSGTGNGLDTNSVSYSSTNGTTSLDCGVIIDTALLSGSYYWCVSWGHAAMSTASGNCKLNLQDFTNGTTLYTFSSNTSSATNTDMSTYIATVVIISPTTGQQRIGLQGQHNNTTTRVIAVNSCYILIKP